MAIRNVATRVLNVAFEEHGPVGGDPVVLLHGFPYDPHSYDEIAPALGERGYRVVVPFLRGYGPTRFLSDKTLRSGQQAALGQDLIDLLDALRLSPAALVGYDWGGRAACITAALWPERVRCLVTCGGYNIQDIARAAIPQAPEIEHKLWYQYYFHSPRGLAALKSNPRELCELLWRLWSPTWNFDTATYARSARSFENPDFAAVVAHSYRHRFAYVEGDAALEPIEGLLAKHPPIRVPTISLSGRDDGVTPLIDPDPAATHFLGSYERRVLDGVGHNVPQEAPGATLRALLDLLGS